MSCRTRIQSIAQKTSNLIFVLAIDAHSASYSNIKALSHHLWFPVALLISVTQGTKNKSVWLSFKYMCVTCSRSINFSLKLLQGAHQLGTRHQTEPVLYFPNSSRWVWRGLGMSPCPIPCSQPHSACPAPVPGQVGCSTSALLSSMLISSLHW